MGNKIVLLFAVVLLVSGCTSVQVSEIDGKYSDMNHVCIEKNEKVIVEDFLRVVQDRLQSHGITTEVYRQGNMPSYCKYRMTYTALKTWDISTYMHHAELRVFEGDKLIGKAEYHLNGKGGLALNKWASVESKMNPVVDKLVENVHVDPDAPKIVVTKKGDTDESRTDFQKLTELKKMYESGVITKEEYVGKKKEILDAM